jgi:hypothetical protein
MRRSRASTLPDEIEGPSPTTEWAMETSPERAYPMSGGTDAVSHHDDYYGKSGSQHGSRLNWGRASCISARRPRKGPSGRGSKGLWRPMSPARGVLSRHSLASGRCRSSCSCSPESRSRFLRSSTRARATCLHRGSDLVQGLSPVPVPCRRKGSSCPPYRPASSHITGRSYRRIALAMRRRGPTGRPRRAVVRRRRSRSAARSTSRRAEGSRRPHRRRPLPRLRLRLRPRLVAARHRPRRPHPRLSPYPPR